MKENIKGINFGHIDHFLYVRILCVCTDLGITTTQFVDHGYFILYDLITEKGVTQFNVLQDNYLKYSDIHEKVRYVPRMEGRTHQFVVQGIHEEIHKHLIVIKRENGFRWRILLQILLMALEHELDKEDNMSWEERKLELELKFPVFAEVFQQQFDMYAGGYGIKSTNLRRKYDSRGEIENIPELPDE